MKAIILAAGYGTRLHPLTKNMPKPLLLINNKPMLERITDDIKKIKIIDRIYIVSNDKFYRNYLAWLKDYPLKENIFILNDKTTTDSSKLGAVGDINFAIKEAEINDDMLIMGADNLFDFNLKDFISAFKKKGNIVALKDLKDYSLVSKYSVIQIDKGKKITSFVEKPKNPKSTLIAACIYAYKKEVISLLKKYIKGKKNTDAPGYFVQWLHEQTAVYGFIADGHWFDIGDIDSYKKADNLYREQNL